MQHNVILNQPMAIEQGYLYSLLANFMYSGVPILSAHEIDKKIENKIELQAQAARSQGASSYPVVIDIIGPIIKYSSWYYTGTQTIKRILNRLEQSEEVSGVVFNIDSGGGMVSGTAELCEAISSCSLPTVAYTNGYMCSAAYDIAAACDMRVAHRNADLIGSIGTMLSYQDFSAMFEKWGAKIYEIYAPQSSEKNIEFRELMKGNEKVYTERLRYLAQDFIDRVQTNLKDVIKDDGHVFKGKTYTPNEALKIGLVDELGTLKEAITKF